MVTVKAGDRLDFRRPKHLVGELPRLQYERTLFDLKKDREPFLQEWRDIADFIQPRRGRFLAEKQNEPRRSPHIINNTGTLAARTLASGMMSGISSPARPWFRLSTPDPDMAEFGAVKIWLHQVEERMRFVLSQSNLYNSLHQVYNDLGTFGSTAMVIDHDFDEVIRATVFAPGEYAMANSARGSVNTLYREYAMTVRQMVEKFGDRCSPRVIDLYDRGSYSPLIDVVDVIEPNTGQITGEPGIKGMPFLNVTFEAKVDDKEGGKVLAVKGYKDFAAPCPRWDLQAGDVYGSGCGILALGDVKAMQILERRKAQMIDKLATPPMQGPTSLRNQPTSHMPGGNTYVDMAGGPNQGWRPAYETNPNAITVTGNEIQQHEYRVKAAFFADLFMRLANSNRRQMTAREVEEIHEEKLLALGPVLERLHDELLNVVVDRTFAVMQRAGILPPPPEEIEDVELKVEYISVLASAQRAIAVGATERFVGFVGNLAGAKPDALDKLDVDQTIDSYGHAIGVDPAIIVPDDKVAEIRKGRADQQAQAQQMEQGMQGAAGAKLLSEAKTGGDTNLLQQLMTGTGA